VNVKAMRSYKYEGNLKPNSIPPQIPNFSVAEFEGWEFSVQKEINTFSPNTEDDDVFKSLFMTPLSQEIEKSGTDLPLGNEVNFRFLATFRADFWRSTLLPSSR